MEETNFKNLTNSNVPVVIRKSLKWHIQNWTLDKWKSFLEMDDNEKLFTFRKGRTHCSKDPLWERHCETVEMTMNDFIEKYIVREESDYWLYFDYKHIGEWFNKKAELLEISWAQFGCPDKTAKDSTIWIGTKGAHTPCHIDTYGCNLVAQLYGRKKWYLFPPSENSNLNPTRIPYEESSVYSDINFTCGCSHINISNIKDVRVVELNPGDVLFVPHLWWHYVENLTAAISINVWLPTVSDSMSRLEESLVKYFVSSVCRSIDVSVISDILNPNEDDIPHLTENYNIEELSWCVSHISLNSDQTLGVAEVCNRNQIYEVPRLPSDQFLDMLKTKCVRDNNFLSDKQDLRKNLIKAFCHPDVIKLVREKLLNYMK